MAADEKAAKAALANKIAEEYLKPPPLLASIINSAKPLLTPCLRVCGAVINLVGPLYVNLFRLGCYTYESLPIELMNSLVGLALAFSGGAYCASIAAIEAFRMSGWEVTRSYLLGEASCTDLSVMSGSADQILNRFVSVSLLRSILASSRLLKRV